MDITNPIVSGVLVYLSSKAFLLRVPSKSVNGIASLAVVITLSPLVNCPGLPFSINVSNVVKNFCGEVDKLFINYAETAK